MQASAAPSGQNPDCNRKCGKFETELKEAQDKLQHEVEQFRTECNLYAEQSDAMDKVNESMYNWKSRYKRTHEDLQSSRDQIAEQKQAMSKMLDDTEPFEKGT